MSKLIDNLMRELKEGRAIYGSKTAIKQAAKGMIEKIYFTNDIPLEIEEKLNKLKEKNISVIKLDLTKEILKDLCKKPFNISVVSIMKSEIKENEKVEKKEKEPKESKQERNLTKRKKK